MDDNRMYEIEQLIEKFDLPDPVKFDEEIGLTLEEMKDIRTKIRDTIVDNVDEDGSFGTQILLPLKALYTGDRLVYAVLDLGYIMGGLDERERILDDGLKLTGDYSLAIASAMELSREEMEAIWEELKKMTLGRPVSLIEVIKSLEAQFSGPQLAFATFKLGQMTGASLERCDREDESTRRMFG